MALTRKMLKGMSLTDEQIDTIIEAHTETVDALKEQRDQYKADADKLPALQKKLDVANEQLENTGTDKYKEQYEAAKQELATLKSEYAAKETRAAKEKAYTDLLKAAGVPEKRLASILRLSGEAVDALELDDKGTAKNADKVQADIKTEWGDYIPTTTELGAPPATPPTIGPEGKDPGEMSMAEYIKFRKGE